MTLVWIAVLGAIGALGRYALSGAVQRAVGERFPAGTLTVNVLGSLAIGVVMAVFVARGADSRLRLALTAGLLGGFTTYSAFAYETWSAFDTGRIAGALANVALTVLLCTGACAIGVAAVRLALR
jgi:CrcB protein